MTSQTVAITGAAGGLGKAIAIALLEAGHNVAICDVNQDRLTQAEQEWTSSHADKFLVSKTDITDEAAVESFISSVTSKFGRLDMLINNAGVMDSFDPVGSATKASWDRVMAINVTGSFLTTKAAVNAMTSQNSPGGTIISICSNASARGAASGVAYTASKHALLGVVRNTAMFYGPKGVNSVALLMGAMGDTNIAEGFMAAGALMNQEAMGEVIKHNHGFGTPETTVALKDVAKWCLFLTDKAVAASVNGAAISVNKNWPAA